MLGCLETLMKCMLVPELKAMAATSKRKSSTVLSKQQLGKSLDTRNSGNDSKNSVDDYVLTY
jgi:hypothetical protein